MKFLNKWFVVLAVLSFAACEELTELDLLNNPNQITPEQAEPRFLYNSIQLRFNTVLEQTFDFGADLSRQTAMTGGFVYQNVYQPTQFDALWRNVYAGIFPDINALQALAEERGLVIHAATADIMKAYLLMTLVDLFGDVPYSEIGQGIEQQNPKADPGADVYAAALELLENAIRDLKNTTASTPALPSEIDNFYGGSVNGWIRAANTLKLRAGVTTRLVDQSAAASLINAATSDEIGFINSNARDFQWNYGTNRNNPNNRHFLYNDFYETTDGRYLSNWYMWLLAESKKFTDDAGNEQTLEDPRTQFYFYRQALGLADEIVDNPNAFDCQYGLSPDDIPDHYLAVSPDMPYCLGSYEKSYFGRDHGNGSGIPPDGELRTNWGLYPMGGSFDPGRGNSDRLNAGTDGALGGGIFPVFLSSWTHMYLAEAALTMSGVDGDPKELLLTGISQSIDKTFSFASKIDQTTVIQTIPEIVTIGDVIDGLADRKQDYLDYVAAEYDAATSDDERLQIIVREFFIAAWGNGMETYNAYRRTCKPGDVQPALERNPGEFQRSALYPAVFVNLNTSTSQKSILDPVFWDTNTDACTY